MMKRAGWWAVGAMVAVSPLAHAAGSGSSDALGRVGNVWFTATDLVQQSELAAFTSGEPGTGVLPSHAPPGRMHVGQDGQWSDVKGDYAATLVGDTVHVKAFDPAGVMLSAMTGDFTVRRDGGDTVIEGTWGTEGVLGRRYPVLIRYSHRHLDMTWGFYERHLVSEPAPQLASNCEFYSRRDSGHAGRLSDAIEVCGAVFNAKPPLPQTVVAFLLSGFRRFGTGAAPEVPSRSTPMPDSSKR